VGHHRLGARALSDPVPVRFSLLERYPARLSPLLAHAIALNRYAAESTKPNGQRFEEYSDANFAALKQQILSPAPIHTELEQTVISWWLAKVREDLGTTDPDFITADGQAQSRAISPLRSSVAPSSRMQHFAHNYWRRAPARSMPITIR
jgi:hypothetical protein